MGKINFQAGHTQACLEQGTHTHTHTHTHTCTHTKTLSELLRKPTGPLTLQGPPTQIFLLSLWRQL